VKLALYGPRVPSRSCRIWCDLACGIALACIFRLKVCTCKFPSQCGWRKLRNRLLEFGVRLPENRATGFQLFAGVISIFGLIPQLSPRLLECNFGGSDEHFLGPTRHDGCLTFAQTRRTYRRQRQNPALTSNDQPWSMSKRGSRPAKCTCQYTATAALGCWSPIKKQISAFQNLMSSSPSHRTALSVLQLHANPCRHVSNSIQQEK
jgi:hypothetical protein